MACTTQSASEYVRSARVHLVRELKSLSVIVENLYQQGVLSDEEVSEIKAEKHDFDKTRSLLDSVRKKGEAACYEFLKIIDETRKRTLGRTMHHWISCFPFKEDTQMDTNYLQGIQKQNSGHCVTFSLFIFYVLSSVMHINVCANIYNLYDV